MDSKSEFNNNKKSNEEHGNTLINEPTVFEGCKFYSEYCTGTTHVQVHLVKYMYMVEAPVTTTVGQLYKLIL